ncbi:MAG TPA: transglutaminase domain-containing protein [Myxococcales bacterium]
MDASVRALALVAVSALAAACAKAPAAPLPAADASLVQAARVPDAAAPGPFLVRGASASYHVTSSLTVKNDAAALVRLAVQLPAPQSNVYQDVSNLVATPAVLKPIPHSDDVYALFVQEADLPGVQQSVTFELTYDVTLYDLRADLAQVGALQPYDKSSDLWRWHTGPSGDLVVPDHPTILVTSLNLWAAHPDVLGYARAAYEHVASSFKYLNPNTGMHPLSEVLAAGGANCGNLASVYISLLRARGIPARHLVAIRPDGSRHVWADFYLQGYGWVPVDVTYKQANPAGDYFGRVALKDNGIIMDKKVDLTVDNALGTRQLPLLQDSAWWYWSETTEAVLTPIYTLVATPR